MKIDKFYVYALLDPRKPGKYQYGAVQCDYEPFYIGKGTGYRCKKHIYRTENKIKSNKINKIIKETGKKPIIVKLFDNLTEQEAFKKEIELISLIGRYDLKLGPLTNYTDGGEGASGNIMSEETKKKLSELNKGEKNAFYGKKHSEESKQKMRKKHPTNSGKNHHFYDKEHSEETKEKISLSRKGKYYGEKHHFYGKHLTEEIKEKLRQSHLGRKHSEESKQKMSNSHKGKKQSKEHIENVKKSKIKNRITRKIISEYFINLALFQQEKLMEFIT